MTRHRTITEHGSLEAKSTSKEMIAGDTEQWRLICKHSNKLEQWRHSTRGMEIPGVGVLVQVSTIQGDRASVALCLVPGARIMDIMQGSVIVSRRIVCDDPVLQLDSPEEISAAPGDHPDPEEQIIYDPLAGSVVDTG
jgi:hypothetical protein